MRFHSRRLSSKKVSNSPMCPVCKVEPESLEHAFLLCPWTEPCWFALHLGLIPSRDGLQSMNVWLKNKLDLIQSLPDSQELLTAKLFFALWSMWKTRNEVVFDDRKPNPKQVLIQTQYHVTKFLQALNRPLDGNAHNPRPTGAAKWRPPLTNNIKINTDAAYSQRKGKGAIGVILRDSQGTCLTAMVKSISASSPLVAEAMGLREAMMLASNLFISSVVFESDNLNLIESCRRNQEKEEIRSILSDIKTLKNQFQRCGFTWTPREGNEAAHCIATMVELGDLNGS